MNYHNSPLTAGQLRLRARFSREDRNRRWFPFLLAAVLAAVLLALFL